MTQGELEARTLDGERAQATAPPEVSSQLRATAQAEADYWQQSAAAQARGDQAGTANAEKLARLLASHRQQLEASAARYEQWSATTLDVRETAGKAKAELERRGLAPQPAGPQHAGHESEPQTMADWLAELDRDLEAASTALAAQHAHAEAAGQPWPAPDLWWDAHLTEVHTQMDAQTRDLALQFPVTDAEIKAAAETGAGRQDTRPVPAVTAAMAAQTGSETAGRPRQHGRHSWPETDAKTPEPPQAAAAGPEPEPEPGTEADPQPDGQDNQAACLGQALAEASEAAQRLAAERQARQARAAYALRREREAQAAPEAGAQAETRGDAEIEL
jgi:hypothetical protein